MSSVKTRPPTPLPREIAPGIVWIGGCLSTLVNDQEIHGHCSTFLIVGPEKTLLVDTGSPQNWDDVSTALDRWLGDRPLDYLFPTHPELPHSGNFARVLAKYPDVEVVGDIRDYHLFYPGCDPSMRATVPGDVIDLGDGVEFEVMESMIRDLPNTQWGFERNSRVLFPADGFSYMHRPELAESEEDDDPAHLPGECGLLVSELNGPVDLEHAAFFTGSALYWTRYIDDSAELFDRIREMLQAYHCEIVAPAHGNVIDDVPSVAEVIEEAHRQAFEG